MAVFKCKMCGASLDVPSNTTIIECDYCGVQQTLPKTTDENIQSLFNRANILRQKGEFDKAEALFEKIILSDETESEAYWGVILCKFGIEYVEDPKTFKRIPTCHRTSYDSIIGDEYYKNAIKYADVIQRVLYEKEAKEIDEIQKNILAISSKEEPYDVFICYKETDETGKRTQDSVIANDIYHQLTNEGFKVFYAAITLEDKLGSAYEPIIFSALNTSKVMLSIGTKPEYFNAVWVKNEWSRFLKIMKKDNTKILIPCYKGMDAYELPEEFSHLQAQDMNKIGFINDVIRGIKKIIVKEDKKIGAATEVVFNTIEAQLEPLIKRVKIFLSDKEWEKANEYTEKILDIDPENAHAYLYKFLIDCKISDFDKMVLIDYDYLFYNNSNYEKAIRFADNDFKNKLIEHKNNEITRLKKSLIYTSRDKIINNNITSIIVDKNLPKNAMIDCITLEKVEILEGVTTIGEGAFKGCYNLKTLILPNSLTTLENEAFSNCRSLTNIVIPEGVTSIPDGAFTSCNCLSNITIPSTVKGIGNKAFYGCFNITTITIPSSVISIGNEAFESCHGLTDITLQDGLKIIGKQAFSYCNNLENILLPNSVSGIGEKAFNGCANLKIVTSIGNNTSANNINLSNINGLENNAFYYCTNLKDVKLPSSITSIGEYAFYGCSKLLTLILPDALTSIGNSAFYNCSYLYNITIPNNVVSIGNQAFYNCSSLFSVTMSNNVESIGEYAFKNCSRLTNVTFSQNLKRIGKNTFEDCENLLSVTIPAGVKTIEEYVFYNCRSLANLNLSYGLISIGDMAFYNCKKLNSVTIPSSVTTIGKCAFSECDNLSRVMIPPSVTNLEMTAFEYGVAYRVKKGGCYIATCVYGSYDCPEVWTLRRFRDDTLGSSWYGRLFIRIYYAISPTLVKWFGNKNWFKKLWKNKLDHMVNKLQSKGVDNSPYNDKEW